jgi:cobalt-precorrin 5A hydrolase
MDNTCDDVYKTAICFNDKGRAVIERLNREAEKAGIEPAELSNLSLEDFARRGFEEKRAMIFVGAVGIAVRAISGYVTDKLSDSPVIVIDDNAGFVIPILSGHAGGANKLAVIVAKLLGAVPVITTSTDVNGAFSADVFAKENSLTIRNREGIKKVSAKAIEGKPVTVSIKDYPPKEQVDIILASDTDDIDAEYNLLLSPKRYTVGIGTKKGKDPGEAEEFLTGVLEENGIGIEDVYAICSIDLKEKEPALKEFGRKYRIPLITFEASVLECAHGDFTPSEFVKDTTGVDNVCERAAVLGAGPKAELIVKKTKGDGITVAIAKRNV